MRNPTELEEAFKKVGDEKKSFEGGDEDEVLQAIWDTLRWCTGEVDFANSIAMHLSI